MRRKPGQAQLIPCLEKFQRENKLYLNCYQCCVCRCQEDYARSDGGGAVPPQPGYCPSGPEAREHPPRRRDEHQTDRLWLLCADQLRPDAERSVKEAHLKPTHGIFGSPPCPQYCE